MLDESWLESWKLSYYYDLMEVYGETTYPGYAYAYFYRQKYILEFIEKVIQPGSKILDIAAAQGNFSLRLAERGYQVTWNDLREELVDYVKLKWEKGIINYAPGNIFTYNFKDQFDVVLVAEVIEHVAHPNQFLYKISQTVKPNGYIIMSTPNGEYFQNRLPRFSDCSNPSQFESMEFQPNADGHIFLLHLDEIKSLSQKVGLSVLETKLFANLLTNGYLKTNLLLKFLPDSLVHNIESFTESLPQFLQRKTHTGIVTLLQRVI